MQYNAVFKGQADNTALFCLTVQPRPYAQLAKCVCAELGIQSIQRSSSESARKHRLLTAQDASPIFSPFPRLFNDNISWPALSSFPSVSNEQLFIDFLCSDKCATSSHVKGKRGRWWVRSPSPHTAWYMTHSLWRDPGLRSVRAPVKCGVASVG